MEVSDEELELLIRGPGGGYPYAEWIALVRRCMPLLLKEVQRSRELIASLKRELEQLIHDKSLCR